MVTFGLGNGPSGDLSSKFSKVFGLGGDKGVPLRLKMRPSSWPCWPLLGVSGAISQVQVQS